MNFSFEHAVLSSNSVKEEGVLIIPQNNKELKPLFVPKNKAVPFYLESTGYSLKDYFKNDQLNDIFKNSPNLIDLWQELIDSDIINTEFYTWTLLDINSNIILQVSQVDGIYDNMLEVSIVDNYEEFNKVIQTAFEQDFVLSKKMYEKYMELNSFSKQDLFDELKNLGDDGSYAAKVNKIIDISS